MTLDRITFCWFEALVIISDVMENATNSESEVLGLGPDSARGW